MAVGPTAVYVCVTEFSGSVDAVQRPVRTCIGCRQRQAAAELLRVVVAMAASGTASDAVLVVPDPDRSAPGRGAWLHPDLRCAQLAQQRRAYGRALRVTGVVDSSAVLDQLARNVSPQKDGRP